MVSAILSSEVDSKFKFSGSQYDFQLPITSLKQDEVIETMKERYDNLKFENLAFHSFQAREIQILIDFWNFKTRGLVV